MIITFDWALCASPAAVQPEDLRNEIRGVPSLADHIVGVTASADRGLGAELEIEFSSELDPAQLAALDACILAHDAGTHAELLNSDACCPQIMSGPVAEARTQGQPVSYTASAANPVSAAEMTFALLPNEAGVTIDTVTGEMSGGEAAEVGVHDLQFEVATTHGRHSSSVRWRVDAP